MKRLLIVANRLPVTVKKQGDKIEYTPSGGGLATGLASLDIDYEKHWVGWPGLHPRDKNTVKRITQKLEQDNIHPIFLPPKELKLYYEGFSNKTIWPLFHYFNEYVNYNKTFWDYYKKVNNTFCEKLKQLVRPDDIIWVHDYHLMLLPGLLRKEFPDNEIGFFLHIPFPSYELFRTLPWRKEILEGLLGSDLIGFHTYEYMRHFVSANYRILGLEPRLGKFFVDHRVVQVETFPMGIDYEKFHGSIDNENVQSQVTSFKKKFGKFKLILSVDRLDYSKGILQRLKAFKELLNKNVQLRGKISLILLVVPSRSGVDDYRALKEEIDEAVGYINGRFSTMDWTPIHYFYRNLPFDQLAALYNLADIALVTPLRDGMNLVAKEFVATKRDGKGVLILSEMAGTAIELPDALIINPNDIENIVETLQKALKMPLASQKRRLEIMQRHLSKKTVQQWAHDFINMLDNIHSRQQAMQQKTLNKELLLDISRHYNKSENKLLLLDYDGTLVPFTDTPEKAIPDAELLRLIEDLSKREGSKLVIISGRNHSTLDNWFGKFPVELIAEHGTWYKENSRWVQTQKLSDDWKNDIYKILNEFVYKTPGSFIEEKPYSLVWHYRKTDTFLADIRVQELINTLIYPCTKRNLEILDGNKVIEVKTAGIDKGTATRHWLNKKKWDFILAIGDDKTDEDIFEALPDEAYSIKVGLQQSRAKYNLNSPKEVRNLLLQLDGKA